jgi:uncharacterized membrane protein
MSIPIMIIGLLWGLYIPGYQLQRLLFKSEGMEMVVLSASLNAGIIVVLAFTLTFLGKLVGARLITPTGVWTSMLAVSLILLAIEFYQGYLATSVRKQ